MPSAISPLEALSAFFAPNPPHPRVHGACAAFAPMLVASYFRYLPKQAYASSLCTRNANAVPLGVAEFSVNSTRKADLMQCVLIVIVLCRRKLGFFAWLYASLAVVESAIVVKFGKGMFPKPWPSYVLWFWGTLMATYAAVMIIWSMRLRQTSDKIKSS